MKKLICLILVLAAVFALTACAQSDSPPSTAPTEPSMAPTEPSPAPTEPSEEEILVQRLLQYWEIWSTLESYAYCDYTDFLTNSTYLTAVPNGNEGLKVYYEYLLSMTDLTPYITKETWNTLMPGYDLPDQTPEELLSRFTIVEDVLLSLNYAETTVDWGFQQYGEQMRWRYNTKGQLVHIEQVNYTHVGNWRLPENRFYSSFNALEMFIEYDENGSRVKNWLGQNKTAEHPVIPMYDNAGRLVQETCGTETLLYSYDDHGQWSRVEHVDPSVYDENGNVTCYFTTRWDFTHTYDTDGKRIQTIEEKFYDNNLQYTAVTDYEYSADGLLSKEIHEDHVITYTYDEKDRILTKTVEYTQEHYPLSYTETYVYGDKYVFDDYIITFSP